MASASHMSGFGGKADMRRHGETVTPSHRHAVPTEPKLACTANVRFSNRPFWVKRFQTIHGTVSMSLAGSCFSSESAPGPFHHGVRERGGTIFWAALPSIGGRSKRTYELTSFIVPRGTSFHRAVEFEHSPIQCCVAVMPLRLLPGSSGTWCRRSRCGA